MSLTHARTAAGAMIVVLAVAVAGCDVSVGNLTARASDTITHSYPLKAGGEIRITNTNGRVDIEAVDGDTVEVAIERTARAATDVGARELLARVKVTEDVKPDRIELRTESLGMLIAAGFEVQYRVRAPRGASVIAQTTNGPIAVTGTGGRLEVDTKNGSVSARGVSGGVHAETTNGSVTVELASLAAAVDLSTTNGRIDLSIPPQAKADLKASCTNGRIEVSDLTLDRTTESRRRLEGRLNGGGTPVDLRTTNGSIRIRAAS